jgi:protein TonB
MSPTAAGMAATLHLLAALALVWATPLKNFEVPEQAIDVTMEEPPAPKAETPPPPQPPTPPAVQAQPTPPPAPPAKAQSLGLPPVEAKPTATDKPKSLPLGLPPPSERSTEPPQQAAAQPPPPKQEPQPEPPKQAAAEPPPKPEPQPEPADPAKTNLPPVEVPPAPLSMQDFVRAAPPPPPQEIVRPQPRVQPLPPPQVQTPTVQQHPPPQLQPSPLRTQQQPQHPQSQASAALVNPADAAARTRVAEDYLWQVGRKMSEHRMFSAAGNEQGNVILRLTIARDGRVMDVGVARSSGSNTLDAASLALARAASPYPPLPPELTGNQITFILPLNYKKFE